MDEDESLLERLGINSSGESSREAPWQFNWKRPRWNFVAGNSNEKQHQGRPIYHSSAEVSPQEILDSETLGTLQSFLKEDDDEGSHFVLSVTLMADEAGNQGSLNAEKRRMLQQKVEYADAILLELMKHKSGDSEASTATQQIITSRLLRWPESALFQDDEEDAEVEDNESLKQPEENEGELPKPKKLFDFVPWVNQNKNSRRSESRRSNGIVSACLCRLPATDPNATLTDALDVLQLLSLGSMTPDTIKTVPRTPSTQNRVLDSSPTLVGKKAEDETDTTVVLCCLHSKGKVYLYSPQKLFREKEEPKKKSNDNMDGDMASLFLGGAMLETLQATYLPLTEPLQKIRLTIPLFRRNFAGPHPFETATTQQLLDASIWDTTVDGPSLRFRTKDNIPCLIVNAFDMLCVAGPGRRVWKRRRRDKERQTKEESVDEVGSVEEFSGELESQGISNLSAGTGSVTHFTSSSRALMALQLSASGNQAGGFVSFLSLRSFATIRTVYLPFAPTRISPFQWGCMNFLLVIGYGGTDKNQTVAVAIRIDDESRHRNQPLRSSVSNTSMVQLDHPPPESLAAAVDNAIEVERGENTNSSAPTGIAKDEKKFVHIRRFQILPISLEGIDEVPALVSGSVQNASPPSLVFMFVDNHAAQINALQRSFSCISQIPTICDETGALNHPLFKNYRVRSSGRKNARRSDESEMLSQIQTRWDPRHICRIPLQDDVESNASLWCHQGQGWCLVGGASRSATFISWEGSTTLHGAFATDLVEFEELGSQELTFPILPSETVMRPLDLGLEMKIPSFEGLHEKKEVSLLYPASEKVHEEESKRSEDPFLIDAIESISSLSHHLDAPRTPISPAVRRNNLTLSHEEKSIRLLQKCPSWTVLEHSDNTRQMVSIESPTLTFRIGSRLSTLSMRSSVVNELYHRKSTPFQHILSWLADKGEFFAAASLALDLLQDVRVLRHLWQAFDKIDDEDEASKISGLLDGIEPLGKSENGQDSSLVTLADMTVACLIKGGLHMASTLTLFLSENRQYDPYRASLMLAAASARTLSGKEDIVRAAMGESESLEIQPKYTVADIVWPVRCLLQIGTSRKMMKESLLLLNATIPDELRHRRRESTFPDSVPGHLLDLCKKLVSLILSSSDDSPSILLGLVDEELRVAFWDSLDQETQMALAVINIDGRHPLLQEGEVRGWVLEKLRESLEEEGAASSVDIYRKMPNAWLRQLVLATLENGGCSIESLMQSGSAKKSKLETDAWGILDYNDTIIQTRKVVGSPEGKYSVDHDVLISALLLLGQRGEDWCNDESFVGTQCLLNATCYAAGRLSIAEPLFVLDGPRLMALCHFAGNIQAGANLVGGEHGLALACVHILVHGHGLEVEDAEQYLLGEGTPATSSSILLAEKQTFELNDWHRELLSVMEQHVFAVRKFGDFDSGSRGSVNPVLAARLCLKTWILLNRGVIGSTAWLVQWLEARLNLSQDQGGPKRLACAALTRALIWPSHTNEKNETEQCLAESMLLPHSFIIQLTHGCCGLVEAVPPVARSTVTS